MGCLLECLFFKKGHDNFSEYDTPKSLWDLKINDIEGVTRTLQEFTKGKKFFIFVNVACK
jgi:hypothetical protein